MLAGPAVPAPAGADAEADAEAARAATGERQAAAPDACLAGARTASVGPSMSSCASAVEAFELAFQLQKDALRFQMFTLAASVFAYLYNIASNAMFFSSLYPVYAPNATATRSSGADAFLVTGHVFAIDTTSAMFVTAGFFSAYMFSNVPPRDHRELCKVFALYVLIDVWAAAVLSLVFGGLFHLVCHSFSAPDVALTILEGALSLRALDVHQDRAHWHSLNPLAWPVLCLFWGTLLSPLTLRNNERLRQCHPDADAVLPWINACMPILLISLFALVHNNSNIFYINTTNVCYRVLEFNLGVCGYSSMNACPASFWRVAGVAGYVWAYVLAAFVTLWWAQLGAPVPPHAGACIRMYHFSPCIEMHHGFLMRGCGLGVVLLARVLTASEDAMQRVAACARTAACLLTWPACYVVHLLLELNFGLQLVRDNAALLTLAVPHVALAVGMLWDASWKTGVFVSVEGALQRALKGALF
jgi:hypothetical protein